MRTLDLLPPHEFAEMNEEEFVAEAATSEIGKNYLRERKEIEEEYRARREKLLETDESESFREPKQTRRR